jgi:alpha-beta hydrolase superfamily lysophospholipase
MSTGAVETHRVPVSGGQSVVLDWVAPSPGRPVAIFVHGFGSHRRGDKAGYFASRFAALGWGFLAPDLRGHGESDGTLHQLTMGRMLEDLSAAVRWCPARAAPVLMIGSSMGAALAAWHLLDSPLAARGAAMIAPSLRFPRGLAERLTSAEREGWRRTGSLRIRNDWLDVEVGQGLLDDAERYDPARLLTEHRTPTLIVHGLRDEAVDWRQSLDFLERSRGLAQKLVLVKDGGHRLTEHKRFLFETMLAWWSELTENGSG